MTDEEFMQEFYKNERGLPRAEMEAAVWKKECFEKDREIEQLKQINDGLVQDRAANRDLKVVKLQDELADRDHRISCYVRELAASVEERERAVARREEEIERLKAELVEKDLLQERTDYMLNAALGQIKQLQEGVGLTAEAMYLEKLKNWTAAIERCTTLANALRAENTAQAEEIERLKRIIYQEPE